MSFFDSVRAWLSQRPPATEANQKLRLLLRASLEIVSAYGAVLERGSSHKTPTIKLSDADLPLNKEQITQAIAILQQALGHPRLRAILIGLLSPIEAQQVLSAEFERRKVLVVVVVLPAEHPAHMRPPKALLQRRMDVLGCV